MTPEKLVEELRSAARQSRDAYLSCKAQEAIHRPEYEACLNKMDRARADHDRAMELYGHVIETDRQARRLLKEADLFTEAADYIERHARSDKGGAEC